MSVGDMINFVVLGILLGMLGQGARSIVGMKKKYDKEGKDCKDWFDWKLLITSLMIGGIAGSIGAITMIDKEVIDKQTLITLFTIGYAGTDFIEGFIKKG